MRAMVKQRWVRAVRTIFASDERKSRDGAQILAEGLGLPGYIVVASLRENDRSATGYLSKEEFEATVDRFFAQPGISVRGWETALHAQSRIIGALDQIMSWGPQIGDIAIVGHGGTGTLLYCHLAGLPIDRSYDQPATNGGNWFAFDRTSRKLLYHGWRPIYASTPRMPVPRS